MLGRLDWTSSTTVLLAGSTTSTGPEADASFVVVMSLEPRLLACLGRIVPLRIDTPMFLLNAV